MKRHLLLIGCPDRTGLVHLITGALYKQGLNIVRNGEFVDRENRWFYMRTEFEGDCDYERAGNELMVMLGNPEGSSWMKFYPPRPKDIVVLVTKEHHCLGDLLVRHAYGDLKRGFTPWSATTRCWAICWRSLACHSTLSRTRTKTARHTSARSRMPSDRIAGII